MGNCKTCGGNSGSSVVARPITAAPSRCSSCSQPASSCGCDRFCEEDHSSVTVYKNFGFTLRAIDAFVWPNVGESVTLRVDSADRVARGSVLWLTGAGYLHVDSFDFSAQTITAKNEGEACNTYEGGESVAACADFVVTAPACLTDHAPLPNTPYLAADFIDPGSGHCQTASVTNIVGLTINDTIFLSGYEYRLGNIYDSNTVSLCNDGGGAALGTTITWDENGDGIEDKPLIKTASENPCSRAGTQYAALLACDGDIAKPYQGSVDGQVPVWQVSSGRWLPKILDAQFSDCTSLTIDLTVDPSHVGSYPITVGDTSQFATRIVVIGGAQFIVNTVDSPTTAHIIPVITPPIIKTYHSGSPVCVDPQPLDEPDDCTFITGDFIATSFSLGPFFTTVNDSSVFTVGQIVIVNGWLFSVTTIPNSLSITLTQLAMPATNITFPAGSIICNAKAMRMSSAVLAFSDPAGRTSSADTAPLSFVIKNHSPTKSKQVSVTIAGMLSAPIDAAHTGAQVSLDLLLSTDGVTYASVFPFSLNDAIPTYGTPGASRYGRRITKTTLFNLAPLQTLNLYGKFSLQASSTSNPVFLVAHSYCEMDVIVLED